MIPVDVPTKADIETYRVPDRSLLFIAFMLIPCRTVCFL